MPAAELRMPADIFDEMAGVREVTPHRSAVSEANVNVEPQLTEINESRLFSAATALFEGAEKFEEYMTKLFKKIITLQEGGKDNGNKKIKKNNPASKAKGKGLSKMIPPHILFWLKVAEFIIKKWPEIRDNMIKAIISITLGISILLEMTNRALKWLFGKLGEIIMWIPTKIAEIFSWIFEKIWSVVQVVFKKVGELLEWYMAQLWKFISWVMRGIKKIAESIWNIFSKLFLVPKNKRDSEFFKSEPKSLTFNTPRPVMPPAVFVSHEYQLSPPSGENKEIKIQELKPKQYVDKTIVSKDGISKTEPELEFIVWHYMKKVFIKFARFIEKIVYRIFLPIIERVISYAVSIVVKFTMYLKRYAYMLIGAPLAAAIKTLGYAISEGKKVFDFICDTGASIFDLDDGSIDDDNRINDVSSQIEDPDAVEARNAKKVDSSTNLKKKLDDMEKNNMENTSAYLAAKAEYMGKLIEQAELTGNIEEAKRLRKALHLPETGNFNLYAVNSKDISDFDLKRHMKEEAARAAEKLKKYDKAAKEEIMCKDELEEMLLAANGEPEWMVIVQRLLIGAKEKIIALFDIKLYSENFKKVLDDFTVPEPMLYEFKSNWFKNKKQRALEICEAENYKNWFEEFLESFNFSKRIEERRKKDYIDSILETYFKEPKPEKALTADEVFEKYGFDLEKRSEKFRDVNDELNEQQKIRFNKWLDILIILKTIQRETS